MWRPTKSDVKTSRKGAMSWPRAPQECSSNIHEHKMRDACKRPVEEKHEERAKRLKEGGHTFNKLGRLPAYSAGSMNIGLDGHMKRDGDGFNKETSLCLITYKLAMKNEKHCS